MGAGVGVAVGVGVGVETGFLATFTPLLHTSFLPVLVQVNLKPFSITLNPAILHGVPAFVEA